MKERLEKLVESLKSKREEILASYLAALEAYDGSMDAITTAGRLHDIDKHITNLYAEIARPEALNG
jgi:hypothetical protein